MAEQSLIRVKPQFYIHVLDNNSSITRLEVGPQTFTRQDHEKVVAGPEPMLSIPPRNYMVIANPVALVGGKVVLDQYGNVKLRHGDEEIRTAETWSEPFPLYPGEKLVGKVTELKVVAHDCALRLRCIREFDDVEVDRATGKSVEVRRSPGDEWLFVGPATYYPRVEVLVLEPLKAVVIRENEALRLQAMLKLVDATGKTRQAGEQWIYKKPGAYLPGVSEKIVEPVTAHVLTDKKALHLRATHSFVQEDGVERKAGEEWLVKLSQKETHIVDVNEELVGEVKLTTLNSRQYCVVLDPVVNGEQQLGGRQLRVGEVSFFLEPGERLERNTVESVLVLGADESLLLRAREETAGGAAAVPTGAPAAKGAAAAAAATTSTATAEKARRPGERWMITGPRDYIPPVTVEVVERRKAFALDENEGIYVRNIHSGKVRAEIGRTYMLQEFEELWTKDLPKKVEELLSRDRQRGEAGGSGGAASTSSRGQPAPAAAAADGFIDKTRVITYRAPHNSAVQVFDYKTKKGRVVFGPEMVMLGPDEMFTLVELSGGKPKREREIQSLCMLLGPDFMTDLVEVETADHARLSLQLAYNWHFEIDREHPEKLFQVPDFVGDACKAIASRVRGAVAQTSFDAFHKSSADIIRAAVFGRDGEGNNRSQLRFTANNLVVDNIDIQSVEPVDQRTRDSLQKSVQLAIEITTKAQEAEAKHKAELSEQQAKGRLERQKMKDEIEQEKARKSFLELQVASTVTELCGHAMAEARARADAAKIEGEAQKSQAKLKAEEITILQTADLDQLKGRQVAEASYVKELNGLEVTKAQEMASIDAKKFKDTVAAIGADTIEAIARAGPEMQAKLLAGLGISSLVVTDGKSPINFLSTAQGLIAPPGQ